MTVMIGKWLDRATSTKAWYVGWTLFDLFFIIYDAFYMGYYCKEGNHTYFVIFLIGVLVILGCLASILIIFWKRFCYNADLFLMIDDKTDKVD